MNKTALRLVLAIVLAPMAATAEESLLEKAWSCAPTTLSNGFKYQQPGSVRSLLSDLLILQGCRDIPTEEYRELRRVLFNSTLLA